MKKALRWIGIILLVGALGAGGFWVYQTQFASAAGASAASDLLNQVVAVQRGDLDATVSVVGELYAVQQEDLAFERLSGTTQLLTLEVSTGSEVTVGEVLATVDTSSYVQALDQAKSELQGAEDKLSELQTPATELQIAQADLAIARAQLNLQQAQQDLDDLYDSNVEELEQALSDAQLALVEAQADLTDVENDEQTSNKLSDLRDKEGELSAQYTRLANETYRDTYYEDRLRVAYDALLDGQDAVARAELQAQSTLLNAQIRVRQAQDKVHTSEQAVEEAKKGVDELSVAQAQMVVAESQVALEKAEEQRTQLNEGADPSDLAAAKANVDKLQRAVSDAEDDLAAATLVAPFSGSVLETYVEQGDLVNKNSTILTLADLDELEVEASVDETTIRQIEAGQDAAITFDALPGQELSGQILSVPLQGELQGGIMVYQVPVSLEGAAGLPLLVGMTANVDVKVGHVDNALLVPTMGLQNIGGFYQVLVPSADPEADPESVPVEVGLSNGVYTQIVRGLNDGDQILVQLEDSNQFGAGFGQMRILMDAGGPPDGGPGPQTRNGG